MKFDIMYIISCTYCRFLKELQNSKEQPRQFSTKTRRAPEHKRSEKVNVNVKCRGKRGELPEVQLRHELPQGHHLLAVQHERIQGSGNRVSLSLSGSGSS